ncbi:hypothetical protein V2O90_01300 [Streptococcus pneumoniae]
MEKLQFFLSQRACGCWKQAEKAVKLGSSETREENIILKGVPFTYGKATLTRFEEIFEEYKGVPR